MTPNNVDLERRPKCSGRLCATRWQQNLAEPQHECPYQRDVNDDSAFRCDCCDACLQECVDDI